MLNGIRCRTDRYWCQARGEMLAEQASSAAFSVALETAWRAKSGSGFDIAHVKAGSARYPAHPPYPLDCQQNAETLVDTVLPRFCVTGIPSPLPTLQVGT